MFTALSDDSLEVKKSLHKFIALSPCVIFNTKFRGAEEWKDENYYETGLYKFSSMGIHAYKGPNWEDDLATICDEFSPAVCEEYKAHSTKEYYPGIEYQATSTLNLIYWWNNGFQNRYQDFPSNFMDGEKKAPLIDVEAIGKDVSIAMFVPLNDELCPFEPMRDIKVDHIRHYTEGGHRIFSELNDSEFVSELIEQL